MSDTGPPGTRPYRATVAILACVVAAFGTAVGVGALEVRRPREPAPHPEPEAPSAYVRRDRAAESLLENQGVRWVYEFGGGLPECWAEVDSEGHEKTLGRWLPTRQPMFIGDAPSDRPLVESMEGYVALFVPTSDEQKYRLVCGVTKIRYLENTTHRLRTAGFRDPFEVTLPNLLPVRPGGAENTGSSYRNDGSERRVIPVGREEELAFFNHHTGSGQSCRVRLKVRFLLPDEIAAKR